MRQHPQAEEFQRQQQRDRHEKDEQRRIGRQMLDRGGDAGLQLRPGDAVDDPRDERAQMLPQPRLEQEDEGEQDPERAGYGAHAGRV